MMKKSRASITRVPVPDGTDNNDGNYFDRLRDDVLIDIVNRWELKDAAKICFLSKRFHRMWESMIMYKKNLDFEAVSQKPSQNFEDFVNRVLSRHQGSSLQSLRIATNNNCSRSEKNKYNFEKWVEFARTKRVSQLRISFLGLYGCPLVIPSTSFSLEIWDNLTSLSLNYVDVRDGDVEDWLKGGLVNLESLAIENADLSRLVVTCPKLKRLEMASCYRLKSVSIVSTPSLQYCSIDAYSSTQRPGVRFKHVPKLSHVKLKIHCFDPQPFMWEVQRIEVEKLKLHLSCDINGYQHSENWRNFPLLDNLEELYLDATFKGESSHYLDMVFFSVLAACPKLHKLTLAMNYSHYDLSCWYASKKAQSLAASHIHECLTVVEFVGSDKSVEKCANFLKELAPNLEKVTYRLEIEDW